MSDKLVGNFSSKKIFNNIFKVAFSNILRLLSGVLIGFLLPKIIGVTDYGYYKTFTLYATYVGLFHFGISDGIYLVYGGKNYEELEKTKFRLFSRVLIFLELTVSSIVAVIALCFLPGELKFIFICLSVYLLFDNITGYYQHISQITGRFNELSFRNIIQSILMGGAVLVFAFVSKITTIDFSYHSFTIVYVTVFVLLGSWYIFTYRDITIGKSASFIENRKQIVLFLKVGFPLLIANLCSSLVLTIDRQFVNVLFDTDTYAIYAFAYNMLALITKTTSAISTVLYPTLKRTSVEDLSKKYGMINGLLLVFVAFCLTIYFPLSWFVNWFLPKYVESLPIFRIILPGLVMSSSITIVMQNYYKTYGKNFLFFVISLTVLFASCIANLISYYVFKTTIAISIASVIVMIIWYLIVESYLIRKHKVNWLKNLAYLFFVCALFYLISGTEKWWFGMIIYVVILVVSTLIIYRRELMKLLNKPR